MAGDLSTAGPAIVWLQCPMAAYRVDGLLVQFYVFGQFVLWVCGDH